jgi:glycosyltransferase involved in cell wall biosynthesis
MRLQNQTILVISPQAWGKMFLAKQHYAIELARAGNEVYFLNPPQQEKVAGGVSIQPSGVEPSLHIIHHSLYFSYKIRFRWMGLFHFLMRFHVNKIRKAIGKRITLIWSFDLGHYYPFRFFDNDAFKIYHPVDEPGERESIAAAEGAHVILSVTREILEKFNHLDTPKFFMHHGLSAEFAEVAPLEWKPGAQIQVGMSGNWLRHELDVDCLKTIIDGHPEIIFNLWGSYENKHSNIGGAATGAVAVFIDFLKAAPNVKLYGPVAPRELAEGFQKMDAFLICYDIEKDQSKGTNYHKVMEYLSTGRVVISSNITTYADMPHLVEMNGSRTDNRELPALFDKITANLEYYNAAGMLKARRDFALGNLYKNKIGEAEALLP